VGKPQSNFTREEYLKALRRIREYIGNGDVYQVNLTQRFSFPLSGEPYYLFQRLFQVNPAPFYAYLNCDDFQVLSTSMERFLYQKRGLSGDPPHQEHPAPSDPGGREVAPGVTKAPKTTPNSP
jgi:para-aminobenzoate synthetase component 1